VTDITRPAAYIRAGVDWDAVIRTAQHQAIANLTRSHGWPEPQLYLDQDQADPAPGDGGALAALTAAISAGRHDAVLIVGPGVIHNCQSHLLWRLLWHCSRHGVSVDYLMPVAAAMIHRHR
jgi:hypothetical protein